MNSLFSKLFFSETLLNSKYVSDVLLSYWSIFKKLPDSCYIDALECGRNYSNLRYFKNTAVRYKNDNSDT